MKGTTGEDQTPCTGCGQQSRPGQACPRRLPIVRIRGQLYFQDDRLQEFRAVDAPWDRVPFDVMVWALAILGKWPE